MEVILLNKVENLGNLGDIVNVKAGYGRNFLIPSGKAALANEANKAEFEQRRAELEQAAAAALDEARQRAEAIAALGEVTIGHRAGEEGRLFGSVGTREIAAAVSAAGVELSKQEVRMPSGALRQTGEYDVELHLHPEVNVTAKIVIVAETD